MTSNDNSSLDLSIDWRDRFDRDVSMLLDESRKTRSDISEIGAGVRALSDIAKNHDSRISATEKRGTTSWPLVVTVIFGIIASFISAVGLMITIGTLAFAPIWMNQSEIKQAFNNHTELDGHPRAIALHESYGPQFDSLREVDNRHTSRLDALHDEVGDIAERLAKREGNSFTAQDAAVLIERIGVLEGKP